jgi:predicted transposase YbfD/YdcC
MSEKKEKETKIMRPVFSYLDKIADAGINLRECKEPSRRAVKRFIRFAEAVDDVRVSGMVTYPLPHILAMAFLAVLGGAGTWVDMEIFCEQRRRWLKKVFPLDGDTPSHDTFRRVLGLVDPGQFADATVSFLLDRMGAIRRAVRAPGGVRHISVDGKEGKSTGRLYGTAGKIPNLQTLNVFDVSDGICLASIPIEKKTNEIPTAQAVLREMQLKGCVVTFDAMNTQKDTVAAVREKKGEYVAGLKGNHETMHDEAVLYFSDEVLKSIEKDSTKCVTSTEKAHNKIEKRRYCLSSDIKWFADLKLWAGLKGFVCYDLETECLATGKKTHERRYYITSLTDIETVAEAVRGHWMVENGLHWHLDVTFSEDDNTTMDTNAFNNLSILNKLALTLYKLLRPAMKKGTSVRSVRKSFGWGFEEQLASLLALLDDDAVAEALAGTGKK